MSFIPLKEVIHGSYSEQSSILSTPRAQHGELLMVREGLAECIVFSKDRSLQLHALLSSYFEKVKNRIALMIFSPKFLKNSNPGILIHDHSKINGWPR